VTTAADGVYGSTGVPGRWKARRKDFSSPAPAMIDAAPTGTATIVGSEPVPMIASRPKPIPSAPG